MHGWSRTVIGREVMPQGLRFYLETSFWARLADRLDPWRRRASRRFAEWMRPRHFALSSDLVAGELWETRDLNLRRAIVRRYVRTPRRIVPTSPRVRRVAWEIVEMGAVTENHLADAFHIAYSIEGRAFALVTWDVNDLARDHTRRRLREYCWRRGLPELRIGTPIEVGRWLDVRIP